MNFGRLLLVAVLLAGMAAPQSTRPVRYRPVLDNPSVTVLDLDLPPHLQAASYQNQYDVLWIGLNEATVTFVDSDQRATETQFRPGDVRFFRSFATQHLVNHSGATFRGVIVVLKPRVRAAGSCGCGSDVEKAVCGCPGADPLPKLWALAVRNVTIAGTTLSAGESFPAGVPRDDTVLVAVTALELLDQDDPAAAVRLQPGEAHWMKAGTHRLRNLGSAPARFVTVEF